MASGVHVMEKPIQLQHHQHQHQHQHHQQQEQQQQQQPHEALKCPRCDSSNTKFCYYNNYSLSQPRHFCKACKRYWTRGGTLRNVPVGGGCRKNKRVKRPISNTVHAATNTNPTPNPHPNPNNHSRDHNQLQSSNSNHHLNPLFYGLLPHQNPNYPRSETRVSTGQESSTLLSGYDLLQPHMNVAGLGFSSLGQGGNSFMGHNTNLTFSSYNSSMYGDGSTSSSTSAPTMASLLASSLSQQQRFVGFAPYDGAAGGSSMVKDLKMEEPPNRMEWNNNNNFHHKDDQIEGVVSSDPNSLLWDTDGGGWLDPTTNIGSSVPSLI